MPLEIPERSAVPASNIEPKISEPARARLSGTSTATASGLLALGKSQGSGQSPSTQRAADTPEVMAARERVRLAERQLAAAKKTGMPDAAVKRLVFELASSRLILAKAMGESDDKIESLSDQMVIAKVLLASTTAKDKTVVAFIRGNHLFMNNNEVDYVRALSPADKTKLVNQCGAHIQVINTKPGQVVYRSSPPAMYFEFYNNYPAQRIQPKDLERIQRNGPQVIPATAANLEKLRQIKRDVDATIQYEGDAAHWGKPQQWNEGEDGRGDCEDFAAKAQRLCLEAGFPREAVLLTFVIDHTNVWHIILTVRTSDGDYCIDSRWNNLVTPQQLKDRGYVFTCNQDKWAWSPYGG